MPSTNNMSGGSTNNDDVLDPIDPLDADSGEQGCSIAASPHLRAPGVGVHLLGLLFLLAPLLRRPRRGALIRPESRGL